MNSKNVCKIACENGMCEKHMDVWMTRFYVPFVVVLLFYVHGKHLRSCRDGQLT